MEIQQVLRDMYKKLKSKAPDLFLDLVKDGTEEVLCGRCSKPISGIHLRTIPGNLSRHLSCVLPYTKMESVFLHFESGHDDLTFTGELKHEGKEDAVCFGCEEQVVGPGYKCSAPECKFLLHQSCAQLPLRIQHAFHPDHKLRLSLPQPTCCEVCGKDCKECFSYKCGKCQINLHIMCAGSQTNNRDDCRHELRPFFQRINFICNACGEEGKDLAAVCNICQLLIHGKCAQFSRTIKITVHPHSLAITYSLREVHEIKEGKNIFCNICREKIKTEYGAYFCKKCHYVAHGKCAYKFFESILKESEDLDSDVEEEIDQGLIEGAEEIQHFSHNHILNLSNEELMDNKLCDACMGLISAPFYSCTICNFFLHNRCVHLPKKKKHFLHPHKLTLTSQYHPDYLFGFCYACKRMTQGFSYRCFECEFFLDTKCSSMPETLEYKGHPHSLLLAIDSKRKCKACDGYVGCLKCVFVCTECEFVFCFKCATFPFEARHRSHKHSLKFTFVKESNSEDYYCLICEKERNQKSWIYYCEECDFPAHIECVVGAHPYIKFGSFFKWKGHQHPLAIVQGVEFSTCDVCGKGSDDGIAIECAQCKAFCHWNCFIGKMEFLSKTETAIFLGLNLLGTGASTIGVLASSEEIESVAEEAGGTSIDNRGKHGSGEEIGSKEEINLGADDVGGTSVGIRGRHDSSEEIDSNEMSSAKEIESGEEIDSSAEEAGELAQVREAGVACCSIKHTHCGASLGI